MTESIEENLLQHCERFEFRQAVRILLATGQSLQLATSIYAEQSDRQVLALEKSGQQSTLTVNLPCLSGPCGIMPHYFQDALRHVHLEQQQPGLFAFIELFNSLILEKRFAIEQYSSLPMTLEHLHRNGQWPDAFLDINGLSPVSGKAHLSQLHCHSLLNVKSAYTGDLGRMLSSHFDLPITVQQARLTYYRLSDDLRWSLGENNRCRLGHGLILGQFVTTREPPCAIHLRISNRNLWQKLQANQGLINELHSHAGLLLNCTTVKCHVEVPASALDPLVLTAGKARLGQYQVLRPETCSHIVQVLLTPE